jgi:hypothetical protein
MTYLNIKNHSRFNSRALFSFPHSPIFYSCYLCSKLLKNHDNNDETLYRLYTWEKKLLFVCQSKSSSCDVTEIHFHFFVLTTKLKGWKSCQEMTLTALLSSLCQFHQHSTRGFFVQKFCAKLFLLHFRLELFLAKEYWLKCTHKNLVKLTTYFYSIPLPTHPKKVNPTVC